MKAIAIINAITLSIIFIRKIVFNYWGFADTMWYSLYMLPLIIFFIAFANNYTKSVNNVKIKKGLDMSDSNQGAGGIKWLCLLVPLLGLVLYLVWQQEKPQAANECGKFALYGVGVSVGLGILSFIFSMAMLSSMY